MQQEKSVVQMTGTVVAQSSRLPDKTAALLRMILNLRGISNGADYCQVPVNIQGRTSSPELIKIQQLRFSPLLSCRRSQLQVNCHTTALSVYFQTRATPTCVPAPRLIQRRISKLTNYWFSQAAYARPGQAATTNSESRTWWKRKEHLKSF